MGDDGLPVSCCQQQETNTTDMCTKENASSTGCETMLIDLFHKTLATSIQVGLIVCMFQVSTFNH